MSVNDTVSEELSLFPEYFQYIKPVIEVQKKLGGSAKPAKVLELITGKVGYSKKPSTQPANPCPSKIGNEMQKVRKVLLHAGLLDSSPKGLWKLTERGLATDLSDINLCHLNELRKSADKEYRENRNTKINEASIQSETTVSPKKSIGVREDRRRTLLDDLKTLPPADLKTVCQEVLRRSGFEGITIARESSENCVEGECIFQKNLFMLPDVMFQFKCVEELIKAEEIRDFRCTMRRRADKGMFMTIGSFTAEAKQEAQRDGVSPVLLIDGEKLVGMIEKFKIRLKSE
jgi:restriction system protein